ncbi:MAG TPA: hypothetical protein VGF57_07105 [Roseiarcus sp.]|jgi:hypothetical protein
MTQLQFAARGGAMAAMRFARAPLLAFVVGGSPGLATAGDFDRSTLPAAVVGPARCDSGGAGPGVLKGSGDCKRISGYIAAGARPDEQIGGRSAPFGPLDAPEFVGAVRAAGAALIAAPAGLDRLFQPARAADVAR